MAHKVICPRKKNNLSHFQNQRFTNSYKNDLFRSGSYDNIPPADLLAGPPEAAVSPRGSLASSQLETGGSSSGGGYELVNFSRGTTAAALKKNSYDYAAQQNAVGRPEDNQSGKSVFNRTRVRSGLGSGLCVNASSDHEDRTEGGVDSHHYRSCVWGSGRGWWGGRGLCSWQMLSRFNDHALSISIIFNLSTMYSVQVQ